MNLEAIITNLITLFVIAIIMDAAVMAVFSMSSLRDRPQATDRGYPGRSYSHPQFFSLL